MNLFVPATFAPFVVGQFPAADPLQSELVGKGERAVCRSLAFVQKTMSARAVSSLVGAALLAVVALTPRYAMAQPVPSGPPAVGVITVERRPMTDTYEFNGRIQAINSVNIVARVSAFLEQQLFTEGTDVKKGDLLYALERPPYQATVDAQKAAVAQAKAQLENGNIELWRKQELVQKNAGTQQALDTAEATQRTAAAQLQAAQAQLETCADQSRLYGDSLPDRRTGRPYLGDHRQRGRPDIGYPDYRGQPGSDVCDRFRSRRAAPSNCARSMPKQGGFDAVKIRLRLPDGRVYGQTGKLDFINNAIAQDTDTVTVRGVIPNPISGIGESGRCQPSRADCRRVRHGPP